MAENKANSYEKLTQHRKEFVDQIIADVTTGKLFEWSSQHSGTPIRPKSLRALVKNQQAREGTQKESPYYHGYNAIKLFMITMEKNYPDNRWCTYNFAKKLGAHVRKGEKGVLIEKWGTTQKPVYKIDPDTQQIVPDMIQDKDGNMVQKMKNVPYVDYFVVFNVSQIEGIEPEKQKEFVSHVDENEPNQAMELMIQNSEAKIVFDQSRSNEYDLAKDEIHVMERHKFEDLPAFYGTVAHEIGHSTGAADRLDRSGITKPNQFGSVEYAKEELRAELTAMFLQMEYGVQLNYKNHIAYLQSWSKGLKKDDQAQENIYEKWGEILLGDPNELAKAANDADKAAQYIISRMIEKNLTKEQIAELRPMDEQKVVLTSGKKVEEIDVNTKEQKPVKTLQLGNSQKRGKKRK